MSLSVAPLEAWRAIGLLGALARPVGLLGALAVESVIAPAAESSDNASLRKAIQLKRGVRRRL